MKRLYPLLSALLLLVACAESDTDRAVTQQLQNSPDFHATFEADDTRTFVDEKVRLLWTEGDLISIFTNTLNQKYEFDGETGDNSGTFTPISSGQFGSGSSLSVDANYAVYPYNQSTKISYDGELSIELLATQAYADDSFGVNANTMVAVTQSQNDNFLSFKNLCGFLKLQLYGDVTVKSIHLEGNNGEKIAGGATVTAKSGKNPTLSMDSDATTSITLDCGAGVKLSASSSSATEFWIVVPPVTFTKGFTITITDTEGGTMTKSTTKSYTVERNVMKLMTAFEVETEQPVQILYTSTDGSVITPNTTTFGSAKIVSNVYEKGQGVITFDKKITLLPAEAFQSKTKLVTISLPESVTSIGNYAFENCSRLTTIAASGVTSVGKNSFYNCAKLEDIPFPNLKTIDDYAFNNCSSISTIELSKISGRLGNYAFAGCSSLDSVKLPRGVTSIGGYAFLNCTNVRSVVIPDSVTEIGYRAFYGCTSLESIYISNLEKWCNIDFSEETSNPLYYGAKLYLNNTLVEDLVIPSGVKKIENYAFKRYKFLKSITVSDNVKEIGYSTFSECTSLKKVTIGNGVTKINGFAFTYCPSLEGVYISDMEAWCNIDFIYNYGSLPDYDFANPLENKANLYLNGKLVETLVIPETIGEINAGAFNGCISLKRVIIGDNVAMIGSSAFRDCTSLTSVEISNSISSIKDNVFRGCKSLERITIPNSVVNISLDAFGYCSLKEVYCKPLTPPSLNSDPFRGNASDCKFYVSAAAVEAYKTAPIWSSYDIVCCDSEDGTETEIHNNKIWYTSIDGKIITPNVETFSKAKIISNVYENGQGVITFDEKVTWIPSEAFQSNKELVTISIPDSISGIGVSAFKGCTSLESVIFSEGSSYDYINSATFYGCISLKSINLPDSVHVINPGAFAGCTSLTSITIPQNVTGIYGGPYYDYDGAFEGCKALNTVYCKPTTPPSLPKYNTGNCWIFSNNAPERKIYVPLESVDAYKKANGWKVYAEDIVGYEF